ncbi:hypothetical protein [Amycolatopsis thermoflava]|uniref:hypothetical protein n=1 Tax=Amycolatopsis thermoflava TaxID=84480 RepID=UPI00365188F1
MDAFQLPGRESGCHNSPVATGFRELIEGAAKAVRSSTPGTSGQTSDRVRATSARSPAWRPVPATALGQAQAELELYRRYAHEGDAEAARRAAELYDLLDNEETAEQWWRLAAALGDQDAIDYVDHFLK